MEQDIEKAQSKKTSPKAKTATKETAATTNTEMSAESGEVIVPIEEHQHSKGGIIAIIILCVLTLVASVAAIWFFVCYNQPDRAAFDAIEQTVQAKSIVTTGNLVIWEKTDSDIEQISLNLNSSSTNLPNTTSVTMSVQFANSSALSLQLGTAMMKDGVIYLQIAGVMDAIKTLGIDRNTQDEFAKVFSTLEVIDNEWWRISVPDVISSLELAPTQADGFNQLYTCVVDALNQNHGAEIAKLYSAYRFMQVQPVNRALAKTEDAAYHPAAWYDLYEVTIDKTRLANFINALPDSATAEGFYNCYNNVMKKLGDTESSLSSSDINEISTDDIEIPEGLHIYLEISRLNHNLRSVHLYADNDEHTIEGAFLFNYQDFTVSEPKNYRPITELVDELSELIVALINGANDGTDGELQSGEMIWEI